MATLTDARQEAYCNEYIIDLIQTKAAIRAGYAESSARQTASRLMTNDNILDRIAELQKIACDNKKITPESVLQDILDTRDTCSKYMIIDGEISSAAVSGRTKSNDQLGKHLKMFTDKVEHSGEITVNTNIIDKYLDE